MDVAAHRPIVANPSIPRTQSSAEALDMRRRLARGTSPVPQASEPALDTPVAEVYEAIPTAAEEPEFLTTKMKLLIVGCACAAMAILAAVVLS